MIGPVTSGVNPRAPHSTFITIYNKTSQSAILLFILLPELVDILTNFQSIADALRLIEEGPL